MSAEITGLAPARGRPRAPLSVGMITTLRECADNLDKALALRIGQMDSSARVEHIMREKNLLVQQVAETLRSLA